MTVLKEDQRNTTGCLAKMVQLIRSVQVGSYGEFFGLSLVYLAVGLPACPALLLFLSVLALEEVFPAQHQREDDAHEGGYHLAVHVGLEVPRALMRVIASPEDRTADDQPQTLQQTVEEHQNGRTGEEKVLGITGAEPKDGGKHEADDENELVDCVHSHPHGHVDVKGDVVGGAGVGEEAGAGENEVGDDEGQVTDEADEEVLGYRVASSHIGNGIYSKMWQ